MYIKSLGDIMANRALVITLSLIMQISFNTVQDVDANINNDTADYEVTYNQKIPFHEPPLRKSITVILTHLYPLW